MTQGKGRPILEIEDRSLSWDMGRMLAGSFFLVIVLGLLGYFQTGRLMQASANRAARVDARVREGVAQAGAVTLASRDTAAYTQGYVYTAQAEKRERKWEAEEATEEGFNALQAILQTLPRSADLRAQCDAAARQNRQVCDPLEARAITLTAGGRRAEAQALWEGQGTAARYTLEIQLDALSTALDAYRSRVSLSEERSRARTLAFGWTLQAFILVFSLLIALAVTRAVGQGVRAALRAQAALRESEARYRLLFERNPASDVGLQPSDPPLFGRQPSRRPPLRPQPRAVPGDDPAGHPAR